MNVQIKLLIDKQGLAVFHATITDTQQVFTASTLTGALIKAEVPNEERAAIIDTIHREWTSDTFGFNI